MDDFNSNNPGEEPDNKDKLTTDKNKFSPVDNIYPRISPITAGLIGLFGGFILYQFVGGLLTVLVFGLDIKNAPANSLRLMTMASQILFILLPALILSKMVYEDVTTIIRAHIPKIEEILLFSVGIIILSPLLEYYLSIQDYFIKMLAAHSSLFNSLKVSIDKLNNMVDSTYSNLMSGKTLLDGLVIILVVSIVPAICEETMFRGFIQRSFEFKIKPIWAAVITAIFFALYHFNPYGLIPLFILGLYFGFAAYTSDSIVVPMVMHFINNFAAVILFFIYGDDDIINQSVNKNFNLTEALTVFFLMAIVFAGLIYLIKRYYSKSKIS